MVVTGAALGRESFGTRYLVGVGGQMIEFPGEITGIAESPSATAGARPRVVRYASGRTDVIDEAAQNEEPKTLTLNANLDTGMLDYQRIAAAEGTNARFTFQAVRDEIPYHPELTPSDSTVAISTEFAPAFVGDSHPSDVRPGAAFKIGGFAYRIARFSSAGPDHSGRLDMNAPVLEKIGDCLLYTSPSPRDS